jgi:hypothetical protein
MATLISEHLEEVTTFVDILKSKAGPNGSWGTRLPAGAEGN